MRENINAFEKTATYMANAQIQLCLRIAHQRGLSPAYIQHNMPVLENGLMTWFAEKKLNALQMQVYRPGDEQALENWDTFYFYSAEPCPEVRKPPIEQVEEFCRTLARLPDGAEYRIFAYLAPDASEVEGWTTGNPLPIDVTDEKEFDPELGYGDTSGKIRWQRGRW